MPATTAHPVDSTTRPCCRGIGAHAAGCAATGRAAIERPDVPPVEQLTRPREWDGHIVHDVAILHLPGGKATIRRHVSHNEVLFTGHIVADYMSLDWIDDDDRADALAELADFVARERRAAREEYERSRGAAIHRHPAGRQR